MLQNLIRVASYTVSAPSAGDVINFIATGGGLDGADGASASITFASTATPTDAASAIAAIINNQNKPWAYAVSAADKLMILFAKPNAAFSYGATGAMVSAGRLVQLFNNEVVMGNPIATNIQTSLDAANAQVANLTNQLAAAQAAASAQGAGAAGGTTTVDVTQAALPATQSAAAMLSGVAVGLGISALFHSEPRPAPKQVPQW